MAVAPGTLCRARLLAITILTLTAPWSRAASGPRQLLRNEQGTSSQAGTFTLHAASERQSALLISGSGSVLRIGSRTGPRSCRNDDDCPYREFCHNKIGLEGFHFCLPCNECNQHNESHGDCEQCLSGSCTSHTQCGLGTWCDTERSCRPCMQCDKSISIDGECDTTCKGICSSHAECGVGSFCSRSQRCQLCSQCDVTSGPISGGCSICAGTHYGCSAHSQCSVGEFCSEHVCWTCAECSDHVETGCRSKCDGHCAKHDECGSGHFCDLNRTCALCSACTNVPTSSIDGTCAICQDGVG